MKKSMGKSYRQILKEFREPQEQCNKAEISKPKNQQVYTFSVKEFLEKQRNVRSKKIVSECLIKSTQPIKIEINNTKNTSPRFRISKLITPLSIRKERHQTSPPLSISPLRQPISFEQDSIQETIKTSPQRLEIASDKIIYSARNPIKISTNKHFEETITTNSTLYTTRHQTSTTIQIDHNLLTQPIKQYPSRTKKQLRRCLIRALKKIKEMGIDFKRMDQVFSKKPYEKQFSQEFIHAVKLNQIEKVQEFLQKNSYLVFDFDFFNMTALHWACKKGYRDICELLIQNHSDIDAIDILNRTPLYLAIESNQVEIVELLLRNRAYPWSTATTDLNQVSKGNRKIRKILTLIRRIDIINMWGEKKMKEEML